MALSPGRHEEKHGLLKFLCGGNVFVGRQLDDPYAFFQESWGPQVAAVDVERGALSPTTATATREREEKAQARASLSIDEDSKVAVETIWQEDTKELKKIWGSLERELIAEKTVFNDLLVFSGFTIVVIPCACAFMCACLAVPYVFGGSDKDADTFIMTRYKHAWIYLMSNMAGLPRSNTGWHPSTVGESTESLGSNFFGTSKLPRTRPRRVEACRPVGKRTLTMATTLFAYVCIAVTTGVTTRGAPGNRGRSSKV